MTDGRAPWTTFARGYLLVVSVVVPGRRRSDWRREWLAELTHEAGRGRGGRFWRRVLLAIPDSIRLRLLSVRAAPPTIGAAHRAALVPSPGRMVAGLARDARQSARGLRRQPGFTTLTVLTIGFGIGAATTMFTLVDGVLLEPLPYESPDRLVAVWPERWFSASLFELLEREAESYEALAVWGPRSFTGFDDAGSERLWGARSSGDFLTLLGATPAVGRLYADVDDDAGADGGVVLTHAFWQSRYAGRADAVGSRLRIANGEMGERSLPILGVLPPRFEIQPGYYPEYRAPLDFAVTVPFDREAARYRSSEYRVVGRLRPGVSRERAAEELESLAAAWMIEHGLDDDFGESVDVVSLKEFMTGPVRPGLILLFGAVGLILVTAVVNVANLLLARGLFRQRDVSVRLALGATPRRVVRLLLAESTLLGLVGCVVGMALAVAGVGALRRLLPPTVPRLESVGLDAGALGFGVALALVTGWMIGILPGWYAGRADVRVGLVGSGARGATAGAGRRRTRATLMAAEIGLAVVLLASAGLLTRSFWRLHTLDPGFDADGLARVYVRPGAGAVGSAAEFESYFEQVDQRIEAIPGVAGAAATSQAPITGDGGVVGAYRADAAEPETPPRVRWRQVSPDYLRVVGAPLLAGRDFDRGDVAGAEPVAIISEQAARTLFPSEDPLGRRIRTGFESDTDVTVVGVTGDIRLLGPAEAVVPIVYRPYPQTGEVRERMGFAGSDIVVRTAGPLPGLQVRLRDAVREVDRLGLVASFETMPEMLSRTLEERRTTLVLLGAFAIGVLLLGAIGIYGVTGYLVRERRRELGVRLAIGASAGRVAREVLTAVLRIAAVGAGVGVAVSIALAGLLRHFVVEIAAIDVAVLTVSTALALAVAALAAFVPAVSAGRTDPVAVLAAEG
ncbi:MAG: ADOP family duplicated permease [Gemmatimonadota bacterium]|nr:ADOP family duplicated permease [Gemmatimonadota bacterium]